ncbi:response regulator [Flocculibacter collagenilyticus]|uniref:response regulator n=1 Tax=Flocculibacter collagenilyticus TaxID=2744479 RepID=UPI0018F59310|nr:response regulator [Flocculibacter collagenilyticus]
MTKFSDNNEDINITTLFVVEDDDVDFKTLMRAMKKRKITNPVIRAYDGLEALEMLKKNEIPKPFIMLVDLQMPRMSGSELLQKIRQEDELKTNVVFILTTSQDVNDIRQSYENQVAGYFLKDDAEQSIFRVVDAIDAYWNIVQLPR